MSRRRNLQSLGKASDIDHTSNPDLYLSLSESNTESNLKTGTRFYESRKKTALRAWTPGRFLRR